MSDTSSFRSVLRGYDPAQVDQWRAEHAGALDQARQEAAERTVEVSELRAALARAQEEQAGTAQTLASLKDEHSKAAAPTYANLGERIGTILGLADEEAAEIRSGAQADADTLKGTTALESDRTRAEADRYAEDVRTKAEAQATQVVEKAKQQADAILDDADREASARREEAEAFYEHQRARAASAAADFEATLGQRRDKAAAEFSTQMAAHESALTQAQERAATLSAESERAHAESNSESQRVLDSAKSEAEQLVSAAKEQAERIRRDSERELSAATARRDSITAQLSNVRQMLATLGGGAIADAFGDHEAAATPPVAAASATEADTAEDDQEAADEAALDQSDDAGDADRSETSDDDDEIEDDEIEDEDAAIELDERAGTRA